MNPQIFYNAFHWGSHSKMAFGQTNSPSNYLAVLCVTLLIAFLSYASQLLFVDIEPHSLNPTQAWIFNGLVICIWITYYRACSVDPGHVQASWPSNETGHDKTSTLRWCRKCENHKPPRAHHCKACSRCSKVLYFRMCLTD